MYCRKAEDTRLLAGNAEWFTWQRWVTSFAEFSGAQWGQDNRNISSFYSRHFESERHRIVDPV